MVGNIPGNPWAALLEIGAAVLALFDPPAVPRRGFAGAVELDAATAFTLAAPVLELNLTQKP